MDLHRSSYVDVFMLHAMAIAVGKLHVSSHTNEIEKEWAAGVPGRPDYVLKRSTSPQQPSYFQQLFTLFSVFSSMACLIGPFHRAFRWGPPSQRAFLPDYIRGRTRLPDYICLLYSFFVCRSTSHMWSCFITPSPTLVGESYILIYFLWGMKLLFWGLLQLTLSPISIFTILSWFVATMKWRSYSSRT